MLGKKEPVKVATLSTTFAPQDEVELPLTQEQRAAGVLTGDIVSVRPFDAMGYELWLEIERDPNANAMRVWELVQTCLPTVSEDRVKRLTPGECGVILLVAAGRIATVQALAEKLAGNAEAPVTTAEQEPQRSLNLSALSASESGASAEATSAT